MSDAGNRAVGSQRAAKSPDAFRTISEVASELDVPQHVLRFWESKFAQVKPMKRGGGRRYYRPEDVELLRRIRKLLYDDGYTIKGVQKVLKERNGRLTDDLVRKPAPAPAGVAGPAPAERGQMTQPVTQPTTQPAAQPAVPTPANPRAAVVGSIETRPAATPAASAGGLSERQRRSIENAVAELARLSDTLKKARG